MCKHGDTIDLELTLPARLSHTGEERTKVTPVDRCIAPLVVALNLGAEACKDPGMRTANSCCGHGKALGDIALHDGRWLIVCRNREEWQWARDRLDRPERMNENQEDKDPDTEPDWSSTCDNCGESPVVPCTGMCGPCTFGEAETAGGNW